MTRKKLALIRLISIILLLLLSVLLILFSDRMNPNRRPNGDNLGEHIPNTPGLTSSENSSNNSDDHSQTNPTDTASRDADELFDVTGSNPHTTLFDIVRTGSTVNTEHVAYSNYQNAVKNIYTDGGILTFSDSGYYTYAEYNGDSHTYRISDSIRFSELFSGLSSAENGNWFFLGALETKDSIYVSYDFWDVDELTLYFRMDKSGRNVMLVYAAPYDELRNQSIFTASNEFIFYIYSTYDTVTGAIESSLMQAEADGTKSGILLPLSDGYSAHHLGLTQNAVIFMVTDPDGNTSLLRLDTLTHKLSYITKACKASDYLYLHNDYAVVGISQSSLVLYQIITGEELLIPLGEAASYALGLPVCDEAHLYLQYFSWDAKFDTKLLQIDVSTRTTSSHTLQQKELCYVTGITKDSLYAEHSGTYTKFPLP